MNFALNLHKACWIILLDSPIEFFNRKLFKRFSRFCTSKEAGFVKVFKIFLRKLQKMHYCSPFSFKFSKPSVNASRLWTKNTNCWEILRKLRNFLIKIHQEKLNFYLFLEKLLLKIEPSEITSFFYNIFFNFGVGTFTIFPHCRRHWLCTFLKIASNYFSSGSGSPVTVLIKIYDIEVLLYFLHDFLECSFLSQYFLLHFRRMSELFLMKREMLNNVYEYCQGVNQRFPLKRVF